MAVSALAVPQSHAAGRRAAVIGGLLLVLLLAALDSTIVATALPTIVGELGGLSHLSWVVTAYLLAQTVAAPLYGKLGDLYGRKRVLQTAVVLFLLGSALCGLSRSLGQLIAFRALQGLGGGGLLVSTQAAIGDVVPPRERGRYQGLFGAVFGVSSIAGPLLGGFFTTHLSWRWIFYVNLPLGAAALAVLAATLPAAAVPRRHAIDWAGAALLAAGLAAIVLFSDLGGTALPWDSPRLIALGLGGVALLGAFVLAERRAAEPVLPPRLFGNPVFRVTSAIGLVVGFALFGSVTYLPLFLQVVKGSSPTGSGLELLPQMLGMLVTSIVSGQLITRWGRYKIFPVVGTAVMAVGLFLLSRVDAGTGRLTISVDLLLVGLGLGMVMQVLVLAVQNAVEYEDLGVATSGATLFRFVGGSVGTAVLGAIFAARLESVLARALPAGAGAAAPTGLGPGALAALPPALRGIYVSAFAESLGTVFLVASVVALLAFFFAVALEERPLRASVAAGSGVGESFAMPPDGDSLAQISRCLWVLLGREGKRRVLERVAARAGVDLGPAACWLLARLAQRPEVTPEALAEAYALDPARLEAALRELVARGLVAQSGGPDGRIERHPLTPAGAEVLERLTAARRAGLAELLKGWSPDQHRELADLLRRLAGELAVEVPA